MTRITCKYILTIFFLILAVAPINKGLYAHSYFTTVNDTTVASDSLNIPDSTAVDSLTAAIKDTLIPVYAAGLLSAKDHGKIFTKTELQKNDYRYAGDLFKYIPAGFVYDMGSLGQPNEISIYGKGFQNISYLNDGINFNNRITNSFDLYNLQSENIDSIEIVPLPKGFLYGPANNPVTVAVHSIDTVSYVPHSRIRFFQAPDDETYIDASFSAYIMKKVNFSFNVTNSSVSSRFDNSNYGGWKAAAKLRYMLSSKLNFVAGYNYVRTETELNGGAAAENKDDINYDNILGSVVYPTATVSSQVFSSRYQKYTQHNLYLKILGNFYENSQTDLTLYRLFNKTEFRQNERTSINEIPVILNDNEHSTTGLALKQNLYLSPLQVQAISNLESTKFDTEILTGDKTVESFSLGGIASLNLLNNNMIPSFFTKYLNYDSGSFYGMGADINFRFADIINFYGGYSEFERQHELLLGGFNKNLKEPVEQKIKSLEIGTKINSNIFYGFASFFNTKNDNELFYTIDRSADTVKTNEASGYFTKETGLTGINLNMNLRIWKLLISSNSTYYFDHKEEKLTLPEFTLFAGVYYIDTLFNENLKLKAGINFYMNGSQNYFTYDFEKNLRIQYANTGSAVTLINNEISDVSYQLDLFVAGQFQDSAILYITFENVLGKDYYIVPYFPKQPRALRFGISWDFLN